MDFVWSSLAFQWADDLEATLRGLYRVLEPGGAIRLPRSGPTP